MENTLVRVEHEQPTILQINNREEVNTSSRHFIEANTVSVGYNTLQHDHIIPVYVKDNEPLISQADFISCTEEIVHQLFRGESILKPDIRISHPIKGRIPEARNKPANMLQDFEKTIYYERMMFVIEVPTIRSDVNGNTLSLTIGGVKSYNLDNLNGKKGNDEHFKIFIGFENKICTNLCVWSDGYQGDLTVKNYNELDSAIRRLILSYDQDKHLHNMRRLSTYALTEHEFATLIGRARMYQHLPNKIKKEIPSLLYGDQQLGTVCKDYYRDESFCRDNNGDINLWRLYNLFTGANKSSYIDSFVCRAVNAYDFSTQVKDALEGKSTSWFLS